ncbi:MAG: hypothetical protein HYY25_12485 [Candidatus Wallbacteria bacterium]|nr:hypothetical protein [Candidatus Wallbacteria bacterium]MBI4868819.1 hypothetical protein [Candidatus Wallbacteria bacterium]
MAAKTKKSEETEAESKSKKSASKSIKAQKPEKVEKAEREKGAEKSAAEKVAKKDKAPARKLGGSDTGELAAAAESRERGHGKQADKASKAKSAHAREFHPEEKYKVGEVIYHPAFKEEGKIIEIRKTPENRDLCVVEFERLGTKRFVFNYSPSQAK